ncbi:PEPxxWA-CTERM sorting domain-containing protein [uncultured Sphingomonas sp.]|uniref:PEPxxWA-CTERM sorting domain-containing protein n=1 Tax=uncultured Sphingomonas sp. TaxID=158754 RepID=UPI0025E3C9A9|nr:PEPxxWA-CTERM sorting domain-containing protein [uncultured Sphingomonas sp.]
MRTRVLTLLAAATAAVAAPSVASAATTINGTLPVVQFNVGNTGGFAAGGTFTNTSAVVSGTGTGDFSSITAGAGVVLSSVTATVGSAISFSSAFGSFAGTVSSFNASTSPLSSVLSLYTVGTFTPTGTLAAFSPGAASLTFTFNQTGGAGSAISGSFTLASPPSGVPEPATWGMMIAGAGMAGAAVRRRRSTKVVAA